MRTKEWSEITSRRSIQVAMNAQNSPGGRCTDSHGRAQKWLALVLKCAVVLLPCMMTGCDSVLDPSGRTSVGLGETQRAGGPQVVWDIEAEPLPEIPLPNDAATRIDPTSPTGRRLNISVTTARTRYEQRTRESFNELDGFGTYAPGYVTFDAPLNLQELATRHGQNDDFRDEDRKSVV